MWDGSGEDKEAVGPSCMLFQLKALAFVVRGMLGRGGERDGEPLTPFYTTASPEGFTSQHLPGAPGTLY